MNDRFESVGATDGVEHRSILGLLAMDAADETVLRHERFLGDEKLGVFGGEVVHRLDHEDLERRHRIEGQPSALRAVGIAERRDELGVKNSKSTAAANTSR
ncbi:hypothetical protein [Methylocystis sp. IM4]|uniref:hypothetical protein n=1 Tax=Methylocystis sp. IM4 TaxID=3136560 RepID=UPI004053546C